MIQGPQSYSNASRIADGVCRFAHVIREALSIGANFDILIDMPMAFDSTNSDASKGDHSAASANEEENSDNDSGASPFESWESWNFIRGFNKYNTRLSVGKRRFYYAVLSFLEISLRAP